MAALLTIHVKAGCDRNEITEIKPEYIKIKISAPPERGKANAELLRFLSKILGVSNEGIEVISGLNSKIKRVKINDLTMEETIRRLNSTSD